MKRMNPASAVALAAALAFALACPLASCARSDNAIEASPTMFTEAPAKDEGYALDDYDEYEYAEDYAPEESKSSSGGSTSPTGLDLSSGSGASSALESQKLIYTASVTLETTEYQKSVDELRALMAECDAFAEAEDEWSYGSQELHTLKATLRVPAESYDRLMEGMGGIEGTVTNRSAQVTNITREYADNEAMIEGLEIQEERLLEMMEQAETIEDMILVEERLSDVQTSLDIYRMHRESMDSDVSLSTVNVTISEVRFATTTAQTSYLARVGNAFADMWDSLVEGLGDFGIGLIYAIPAIVIVIVVVLLVRRAIRKHRKKKANVGPSTPEGTDEL